MITMNFSGFFDRDAVMKAVGKANRQILNQMGRKVRSTAQKSLIYSDKPSRPGQPPHAHKSRIRTRVSRKTGKVRKRSVSFLREFLFYAYEFDKQDVVVGPAKLNSTIDSRALLALEEGGTSRVPAEGGKTRTVTIRKRPYMKPALMTTLPDFPKMWANSVRA